jgi:hypothetical protein
MFTEVSEERLVSWKQKQDVPVNIFQATLRYIPEDGQLQYLQRTISLFLNIVMIVDEILIGN